MAQAKSMGRAGKQAASWIEGKFIGGRPDPAVMNPVLPPLPPHLPWVRRGRHSYYEPRVVRGCCVSRHQA